MRASLLTKLVAAYLVPTLALLVFAPLLGWAIARRSLEEEVGKRLVGSAGAAAATLNGVLLLTLQPGDDGNRTHRNVLAKLEAMRAAGNVRRLYVVDRGQKMLAGTGEMPPIGEPLPELERDRVEIERALAGVAVSSSVTFKGLDGRTYKSGYAPVLDSEGKVVAVVGADASAEFFEVMRELGASMVGMAVAFGLLGLGIFYVVGYHWLLRPIRRLCGAAERIGGGDLESKVSCSGDDELGALAEGMDRMRGKLQSRERELQMMLAGVAHEVRNPLGGIELFAGLLAEELEGDEGKLSHVRKVQRELGHLKRVVEDFLGFARDPRLTKESMDARELLDELSDLVRGDADAKGVSVVVESESVRLEGDRATLRRALLNLAQNAIQAAPQGGHVWLRARTAGESVVISVADDGPGVPEVERAKIFTPFFTTKEKGLGLGLAFVRRIAEAHGGTAALRPGEGGAVFELELPGKAA
ncbi:MAG: ATP-binding protein [Myxococcales bacterium]